MKPTMKPDLAGTGIALAIIISLLSWAALSHAAAEKRTALVIGNGRYASSPLGNPVNDATDMAQTLKRLGFDVTLKKNASRRPMEEAIREFGSRLKKRKGVGLFFYAGHGLQINGANYLIPVGARIDRESDVQFEAVNVERILAEMAEADNGLNIVMLDACRDNPYRSGFRSASRGLAVISNAPTGTFISYSTAPGQVARDGSGRNSPYTSALLQTITEPGLTIEDVFKGVRQKIRKETGQVPWELSSLEGKFYFVPGKAGRSGDTEPVSKKVSAVEKPAAKKRPPVSAARETRRDGRFIAYSDGTVLDTWTNLMWAARDNGSDISWAIAKSYCENHRGGGHEDWRMPTQEELAALYDSSRSATTACSPSQPVHMATELIRLSCLWAWASEVRDSYASGFFFADGSRGWPHQSASSRMRALPVRSAR